MGGEDIIIEDCGFYILKYNPQKMFIYIEIFIE